MSKKLVNISNKPINLESYLKSLRKSLKSTQTDFWKEIRAADRAYQKEMEQAMRDYEKVEYSTKRVPSALSQAAKIFIDRYDDAYRTLGKTTKESIMRFQKTVEELIGMGQESSGGE